VGHEKERLLEQQEREHRYAKEAGHTCLSCGVALVYEEEKRRGLCHHHIMKQDRE
jgi:hypothetical protein